jgi:hypothetical protein
MIGQVTPGKPQPFVIVDDWKVICHVNQIQQVISEGALTGLLVHRSIDLQKLIIFIIFEIDIFVIDEIFIFPLRLSTTFPPLPFMRLVIDPSAFSVLSRDFLFLPDDFAPCSTMVSARASNEMRVSSSPRPEPCSEPAADSGSCTVHQMMCCRRAVKLTFVKASAQAFESTFFRDSFFLTRTGAWAYL